MKTAWQFFPPRFRERKKKHIYATVKFPTAFSVIMVILKHYENPLLLYRLFQIYPAKNNPLSPMRGIKLLSNSLIFSPSLAFLCCDSKLSSRQLLHYASVYLRHHSSWLPSALALPFPPCTLVCLEFVKRCCAAAPPCVGFWHLQGLLAKK